MAIPNVPGALVRAVNTAAISPPSGLEADIGWAATALGNALLVSLAGAPVVVAVNLDLADDEVATGGPDLAGTRRLFQGFLAPDSGGANNLLETLARRASSVLQSQVVIVATPGATVISAANLSRLAIIVRNIEGVAGDRVFVGTTGVTIANGMPLDMGTTAARAGDSIALFTTAAVVATGSPGAGLVSVLEFIL
jgi:hypothetical protein